MEPLELDLTRCLMFVLMSVSVSAVYGATRVGLDSMSDVCFDVCFVSVSDTSSIELMFLYTNRRKIKFLVSCI